MNPLDPTATFVIIGGTAAFCADVYLLGVRPARKEGRDEGQTFFDKHREACRSFEKGASLDFVQRLGRTQELRTLMGVERPSNQQDLPPETIQPAAKKVEEILAGYRVTSKIHDSLERVKDLHIKAADSAYTAGTVSLAGIFLIAVTVVLWYDDLAFWLLAGFFAGMMFVAALAPATQWSTFSGRMVSEKTSLEKELNTRFYFPESVPVDLSSPPPPRV